MPTELGNLRSGKSISDISAGRAFTEVTCKLPCCLIPASFSKATMVKRDAAIGERYFVEDVLENNPLARYFYSRVDEFATLLTERQLVSLTQC
jgi:hypothetical protein